MKVFTYEDKNDIPDIYFAYKDVNNFVGVLILDHIKLWNMKK